ncbi:uncharacterized protein LTR77_000363 [Saxophila tyrrhenica]|uniref:SAGA-associated factor 11 n=1 Tax=Saxophila tyrrhenica TaxID=1690608 RepID=A0AAV9PMM0_9PEZI|nr:hypothetical protein LTR77_000363 [Saxophila tyrrhenica]
MASPSLASIGAEILQGEINNIIHDILIDRHRDHKLMVMNLDPTTKLAHCERCNLPRLLDPPLAPQVRGATSDPPSDTVYCDKKPWCRKPGFDIYGNPFLKADLTGRPPNKKEREAAKNNKKDGGDGTPASNEGGDANGTGPPSPSVEEGANAKADKVEKGEKKASKIDEKLKKGEYIPWQTCPNCKRSLLITRFAKHLEQCMGLSGRAASRNAMAKMNGNTPAGSRGGTPGPTGSQGDSKGGDEDDDEDEKIKGPGGVRKKVLKKGLNSKLKKAEKEGKANSKATKPSPGIAGENGKRDRDEMSIDDPDEDENVHVKKRQKLQRVESTASFASQSSVQPGCAVEMERAESNDGDGDGSFVDDAGSFADD